MGPIVLLTGVLVLLYAVATMAAGSAASATRGVQHSRRYALVTALVGIGLLLVGLAMIVN
jgi:Na+/phosphate symporter